MDLSAIVICILIMALVTYLPRVIPLVLFRKKIKSRFIQSFLMYMPYGVLAAMVIPAIFTSTSYLLSACCGAAVSLIMAYRGRGLMTTTLGATAAVFLTEIVLRFLA